MFQQPELKYGYADLEPTIDALTMETHYSKHFETYTKKLNEFAKKAGVEDMEITKLLESLYTIKDEKLRTDIRNNGGGFYNHALYFSIIGPKGGGEPSGELGEKIKETFGSFESFKDQISELALCQFGSGYAWLSVTPEKELVLSKTDNQDNPISLGTGNTPILNIDVWEHAYYLKYKNMRVDYVNNFFDVVDWKVVEENYQKACNCCA